MRPLVQVDSGGEVYLRFCERKLTEYHARMIRSGAPRLSRTYFVSDGTTIYIESVAAGEGQFRDSVRIIVPPSGFDFLAHHYIAGGTDLWALKRDPSTLLYIPVLVDTLTATHNPWHSTDSQASQPPIFTRDKSHGVSAWGGGPPALSLRRGAGISPADTRPIPYFFAGASTPISDMMAFSQNFFTGPAVLRRLGNHADTDFPLASFITRAKAIFPESNGWIYSSSVLYPVAPNKVLAVTRPVKGDHSDRTIYAERFRVDTNPVTDTATLVVEAVLKTDETVMFGPNTVTGERYYDGLSLGVYTFKTGIGELEWSKYTFTDIVPTNRINPPMPSIPMPFNVTFIGDALAVVGAYPHVPKSVQFNGVMLHNELSTHGFPFLCSAWPTAVRIEDDQYWWINADLVKSSDVLAPSIGPTDYKYTSPHEYRYRNIAMKNGAVYRDQTDSRNFTSTTDGAPVDSWDSTAPVYIYSPTDGVRLGGVDWFCGVRIEETFTSGGTNGAGALVHKIRPAVWKADLSAVYTYASFEQSPAAYTTQAGVTSGRYIFAKYKKQTFFVFSDSVNLFPWAVGMDAPSEAPVRIHAFAMGGDGTIRANPAVRSL